VPSKIDPSLSDRGTLSLDGALQLLQQSGHPLPERRSAGDAAWLQAVIDGLCQLSSRDPLTGLANRRHFEMMLASEVDRVARAGEPALVLMIDIDHFKQVNDQLGHDEGDRLLGDFAARLSSQTRRVDVIGRWGGEEFAIFYQDAIEDEASWSLARIADRMRQEPIGTLGGQPITFSAGLCAWREGPVTAAISRADEALYRAKRSGRDQIQRAERPSSQAYG
jgi:diguanylate cyclase (GGDEF)-like protein